MAGSEAKRQKAAQRKAAKRKEKKKVLAQTPAAGRPLSQTGALRAATHWPVFECFAAPGWTEPTTELPELTPVVVSRRAPTGRVAVSWFLVDLACLGVKNADAMVMDSEDDFRAFLSRLPGSESYQPVSFDCASKIVQEGVAYARQFEIAPHKDYFKAAPFLEGASPDACTTPVNLGWNGKPYFVSGPHDNVQKILARLTKAVGPGNFEFVGAVPSVGHGAGFFDDWEAGEEADEEADEDDESFEETDEGELSEGDDPEDRSPKPPLS
jgi:hypothetical protein